MLDVVSKAIPPISVKTVVACLMWYSVSSLTSQLTKLILVRFPYPLFLGQFQFFIGGLLALTFIQVLKVFPQFSDHFPAGSVPLDRNAPIFNKSAMTKVLPLGLFQFAGKFFSLSATSMVSLSTVSSIKALSPLLIVAGYSLFYGVKFPMITYISLSPLVGGVILIIATDSNRSYNIFGGEGGFVDVVQIWGVSYAFLSTFIFAGQNIYGKQLITWGTETNSYNPASLVLNTEPSRAGTPSIEISDIHDLDDLSKEKRFIRQRTNSIKLPFSTSDLALDERNEHFQGYATPPNHYMAEVERNASNLSPFAYISSKLKINHINKPDKMSIILYCSSIGFAISFVSFLLKEFPVIVNKFFSAEYSESMSTSEMLTIVLLIILDCTSHFLQTLLAFHLLGSIPALSYSIASMMKRIVLILVSILITPGYSAQEADPTKWFGKISTQQLYGLILIAIGLYSYDRWGSRSLKPGHS